MIFSQKIIKIGNSFGVIIPKTLVDYLGWKAGTLVDVSYRPRMKAIIVRDKSGQGVRIRKKIAKKKSPNGSP